MSQAVLTERRGHVLLVTLNRPDAMNSVNAELAAGLGAALAEAEADIEVRAVVITGAGERAFCAGMDLKAFARGEGAEDPDHPEWGFAGIAKHVVDVPVITAVNGFAFGGGAEIVLASDIAIASHSAKLGFPEVTRGLVAAAGGVIRLPRQVPRKLAAELILTGDAIDADRALELGLVNRVVDPDRVVEEALELAQRIAKNAPLAVQTSKRFIRRADDFGSDWGDDIWQAHDAEVMPLFSSDDAREGATAFAEKREPVWKGR